MFSVILYASNKNRFETLEGLLVIVFSTHFIRTTVKIENDY